MFKEKNIANSVDRSSFRATQQNSLYKNKRLEQAQNNKKVL